MTGLRTNLSIIPSVNMVRVPWAKTVGSPGQPEVTASMEPPTSHYIRRLAMRGNVVKFTEVWRGTSPGP